MSFLSSLRNSSVGLVGLLALILLVSCGEDSRHFKIEGRLLQMNSGEFYVYSTDGDINGFDTIKVEGGRFAFEMPCERAMTLTVIFPNFSQIPIFAEPGKTVTIKGDASHLKALEIKGTKTNELMSSFRERIASASPPEIKQYAAQFIADHPESPIGLYLVRQYFVTAPVPDYGQAARLIATMRARQPDNSQLGRLEQQVKALAATGVGKRLPVFSLTDINGRPVTQASLSKGLAVILVWATWNYNSTDMMRQLRDMQTSGGKDFRVIAISVDASRKEVMNYVKMNDMPWTFVCTGEMFETKALRQLGLLIVPGNIIVRDGRIVARDVPAMDLPNRVKSL